MLRPRCLHCCQQLEKLCRHLSPRMYVPSNHRPPDNEALCQRRQYSTSGPHGMGYKLKDELPHSYALLDVQEGCSYAELKDAYVRLAKRYHPDSGPSNFNPEKFSEVQQAYRHIRSTMKSNAEDEVEKEEAQIIFDIRHTAPQHRQFLNFEGIGYGTPSQRQRQYQQHRVAKATERVHEHRSQKLAIQYEDALVVKDKQAMKKQKSQGFIDRLVEDLIRESMEKGDFENLPGKGKPLCLFDRNPFVDSTTHNLNKILINDGFAPEWIALEKEIREEVQRARQTLARERDRLGLSPLMPEQSNRWLGYTRKFRARFQDINAKIHKYNMIVPFLNKQMAEYNVERDIRKIEENWEAYLTNEDRNEDQTAFISFCGASQGPQEKVKWSQVWKEIKADSLGKFQSCNFTRKCGWYTYNVERC